MTEPTVLYHNDRGDAVEHRPHPNMVTRPACNPTLNGQLVTDPDADHRCQSPACFGGGDA